MTLGISSKVRSRSTAALLFALMLILTACSSGVAPQPVVEDDDGGKAIADQNLGERLFNDTRFAQYFAAHMTGVNAPLAVGDPVVTTVQTINGPLPGPFAGQAINCRSCHFVTEFQGVPNAGNRTYADFIDHSPLPRALNGFTTTPRNSMQMVGSLQSHSGPTFLHFDGEFATPEDLVKATFTGRNFGWDPTQYQDALAQIALVIRQDNGQNYAATTFGGGVSYKVAFQGTDPSIPVGFVIPSSYRIDVTTATDEQILDDITRLVAAYMEGLLFKQDQFGRYYASPYDVFLRINHLPQQPNAGEADQQYNQRLLQAVNALSNPKYVDGSYGAFQYHDQPFAFGAAELSGMKIFLSAANNGGGGTPPGDGPRHAGNCAACHLAPNFTDFRFHNTGTSQEEYDAINGPGAFAALAVPNQADRINNFDAYFPASANHPNATERFRHRAEAGHPEFADLGLWNVYLNPDMPNPQANLTAVVCANMQNCAVDQGLPTTIGQVKTPTLRDLADSTPYLHNGSKLTLNDVVHFYVQNSQLARQGLLRNPPPEFRGMALTDEDIANLVAFLKALTEDYDDA